MAGPQAFTVEGWFKTTTNQGGKLIGFGSSQTGSSSSYDRHIYMMNDGQLVFGIWNNQTETIETPNTYNDGGWHYLAATYDGSTMAFYVDGQLIGTNPSSSAQAYSGYWRVGGDNLNGFYSKVSCEATCTGTTTCSALATSASKAVQVAWARLLGWPSRLHSSSADSLKMSCGPAGSVPMFSSAMPKMAKSPSGPACRAAWVSCIRRSRPTPL